MFDCSTNWARHKLEPGPVCLYHERIDAKRRLLWQSSARTHLRLSKDDKTPSPWAMAVLEECFSPWPARIPLLHSHRPEQVFPHCGNSALTRYHYLHCFFCWLSKKPGLPLEQPLDFRNRPKRSSLQSSLASQRYWLVHRRKQGLPKMSACCLSKVSAVSLQH